MISSDFQKLPMIHNLAVNIESPPEIIIQVSSSFCALLGKLGLQRPLVQFSGMEDQKSSFTFYFGVSCTQRSLDFKVKF